MKVSGFDIGELELLNLDLNRLTNPVAEANYSLNHNLNIEMGFQANDENPKFLNAYVDVKIISTHPANEYLQEPHKLLEIKIRNNYKAIANSKWPIDEASSNKEIVLPRKYVELMVGTSIGNTRGYLAALSAHLGFKRFTLPLFDIKKFYKKLAYYSYKD